MTRFATASLVIVLSACGGSGTGEQQPASGGSAGQSPGGSGGTGTGASASRGGSASGGGGTSGEQCGGVTCGPNQYCCGPSECGFCAANGTGPFCGFECSGGGAGGSGGSAGTSAGTAGAAADL